jgi:hypothetical protein
MIFKLAAEHRGRSLPRLRSQRAEKKQCRRQFPTGGSGLAEACSCRPELEQLRRWHSARKYWQLRVRAPGPAMAGLSAFRLDGVHALARPRLSRPAAMCPNQCSEVDCAMTVGMRATKFSPSGKQCMPLQLGARCRHGSRARVQTGDDCTAAGTQLACAT